MKIRFLTLLTFLLSLGLLLTACGPQSPAPSEPDADSVATQVSVLLTASPVFTPIPPLPSTEVPLATPTAQFLATATPLEAAPTQEPAATTAPTDTPVPTSTNTPQPTTTPLATDPRQLLGGPTWQDKTFKENQNWGEAWDGEFTRGQFRDSQLVFTSTGVDGWTMTWPRPEDFYIEMTARTGTCSGKDRYGIIVRVPDTNNEGYLFGVTCDGYYSLRRWDPEDKRYEALVNWTASDRIVQGSNQTNRLGLRVEDGRFQMYANGHYLGEATDDTLKEGRFGPWIGHDQTENFTIYISEISYWDLP
jgi:hypothetical protein